MHTQSIRSNIWFNVIARRLRHDHSAIFWLKITPSNLRDRATNHQRASWLKFEEKHAVGVFCG